MLQHPRCGAHRYRERQPLMCFQSKQAKESSLFPLGRWKAEPQRCSVSHPRPVAKQGNEPRSSESRTSKTKPSFPSSGPSALWNPGGCPRERIRESLRWRLLGRHVIQKKDLQGWAMEKGQLGMFAAHWGMLVCTYTQARLKLRVIFLFTLGTLDQAFTDAASQDATWTTPCCCQQCTLEPMERWNPPVMDH